MKECGHVYSVFCLEEVLHVSLEKRKVNTIRLQLGYGKAILSPMLYNTFLKDIFKQFTADHCKNAEDSKFWHKEKMFQFLLKWFQRTWEVFRAERWRMKISCVKTEVTVLSSSDGI